MNISLPKKIINSVSKTSTVYYIYILKYVFTFETNEVKENENEYILDLNKSFYHVSLEDIKKNNLEYYETLSFKNISVNEVEKILNHFIIVNDLNNKLDALEATNVFIEQEIKNIKKEKVLNNKLYEKEEYNKNLIKEWEDLKI